MVTYLIIGVTVVVSYICFGNRALFHRLAFIPYRTFHQGEWYRLVTHGFVAMMINKIMKRLSFDEMYAFHMGKRFEPETAVILSHPAFADSSERKSLGCQMYNGVVDAASAEMQPVQEKSLQLPVPAENISRQRSRMSVHIVDDLFILPVCQYRHQRAEYLVLHHGAAVAVRVGDGSETEDRRLDFQPFRIGGSAEDAFVPDFVHHSGQAVEMLSVDDFTIVGI